MVRRCWRKQQKDEKLWQNCNKTSGKEIRTESEEAAWNNGKKVSKSGKKKIKRMKKMERGIEELEIIGKPTAKGLKLEDKSKKKIKAWRR